MATECKIASEFNELVDIVEAEVREERTAIRIMMSNTKKRVQNCCYGNHLMLSASAPFRAYLEKRHKT